MIHRWLNIVLGVCCVVLAVANFSASWGSDLSGAILLFTAALCLWDERRWRRDNRLSADPK